MESTIKFEGLEMRVNMTEEQVAAIVNIITEAATNSIPVTLRQQTEPKEEEKAKEKEEKPFTTAKPYSFKPGSRNEHLFGSSYTRTAAEPQKIRTYGSDEEGYKGFLCIKCDHCGEIKGFNSKYPLTYYRCRSCGETTSLKDLKPMFLKCKCGKTARYKTNITEQTFEFPCLDCGSIVDFQLNEKKGEYISL